MLQSEFPMSVKYSTNSFYEAKTLVSHYFLSNTTILFNFFYPRDIIPHPGKHSSFSFNYQLFVAQRRKNACGSTP